MEAWVERYGRTITTMEARKAGEVFCKFDEGSRYLPDATITSEPDFDHERSGRMSDENVASLRWLGGSRYNDGVDGETRLLLLAVSRC